MSNGVLQFISKFVMILFCRYNRMYHVFFVSKNCDQLIFYMQIQTQCERTKVMFPKNIIYMIVCLSSSTSSLHLFLHLHLYFVLFDKHEAMTRADVSKCFIILKYQLLLASNNEIKYIAIFKIENK